MRPHMRRARGPLALQVAIVATVTVPEIITRRPNHVDDCANPRPSANCERLPNQLEFALENSDSPCRVSKPARCFCGQWIQRCCMYYSLATWYVARYLTAWYCAHVKVNKRWLIDDWVWESAVLKYKLRCSSLVWYCNGSKTLVQFLYFSSCYFLQAGICTDEMIKMTNLLFFVAIL